MREIFARITADAASQVDSNFRRSLDALERGECSEEEFVRQALLLRASSPNWAWSMLALIDQRYRRGALAEPIFRSIKSQISRHAVEDRDYGTTVELHPAPRTSADVSQEIHIVTAVQGASMRVHAVDRIDLDRGLPTVFSVPSPVKQAAPQPAEVGRVLRDRYELEGLLGRGGMGTVFKALDRNRRDLAVGSRYVAIKVLHESISRRPEILADLRREFYCAQALSHPNIVKVYELHQEDDAAFFTMELIEGELLSGVLRRIHPRPLARHEAWAIIRAVGAGLTHAHSRNVVHGDLKPQNIMLTERGEIRILDFGASSTSSRQWSTSDALQRGHFLAVTPAYTCCELLDGQQTDPRDDLYALACLSYELLGGDHPFQGRCSTEARDLEMQPRRPRGLTHRQWRSLRLGLSWYREDRPSVRAWLEDLGLERVVERLPAPHDLDAMQARDWTLGVARRAALVVAVIVGAGLWIAFGRTSSDVNHAGKQHLASNAAPVAAAALQSTTTSQLTVADARVFTQPPVEDVLHPLPDRNPASVPAQPEFLSKSAKPLAMTVALRPIGPPKITLSADTYKVPAGERFAEIDVDRSGEIAGSGSFVWWTEPASAKAGNDFVYQGRTTQRFSNGRHVAKIFVRLIPNPTRTHLETFYVAIADPSREFSLGHVARAAVLIPPGS